jgi:hypothetical protein
LELGVDISFGGVDIFMGAELGCKFPFLVATTKSNDLIP